MKKQYSLVLGVILLAASSLTVHGETTVGGPWRVAFTEEETLESSFSKAEVSDVIYGMQPGDQAQIDIELVNEGHTATDWYMTNRILSSLEDFSEEAGGGAYAYRLAYTAQDGTETVLFESDTVGGDAGEVGEGLHGVGRALEEFFYLDTLASGENGMVSLTVALDGETQGNGYQDTLADLQMNFAVELNGTGNPGGGTGNPEGGTGNSGDGTSTRIVKTGDESRLGLFVGLTAASGLLLLLLAFFGTAQRRKQEKEVR